MSSIELPIKRCLLFRTYSALSSSYGQADLRVNIEFLTWPIIRYKREVLFGWVDLLVSFGGIAGLFLGFSLLSGVEILYYFTLRAGCMFVKNRVNVEQQTEPNPLSDNKYLFTVFSAPFLCSQETLYALQNVKESRPHARYDLSITPNLKSSRLEARKSLSMTNIQIGRPVDASADKVNGKSFDGLVAPIKYRRNNDSVREGINRLDVLGRLARDVKHVSEKNVNFHKTFLMFFNLSSRLIVRKFSNRFKSHHM